MKKKWLIIPLVLIVVYLAGPQVKDPELELFLPEVPVDLTALEQMILSREDTVTGIKADNQARIIWNNDTLRNKTPYAIVYLHGWSASYMEGDPIHREIAERYGFNLYLPRLYGHGIDVENNFCDLTADKLLESAREALAIARQLGDSVIIMGTSTGGTLGLYLANAAPEIAGQILYSPNIRIYDKSAAILDDPWGIQIARLITGSSFHSWEAEGPRKQYWTTRYCLKSLGELQALVDETMVESTFRSVTDPVFVGCYYKNDSLQDNTVSVEAIVDMYEQLGSEKKKLVRFPEVGHHVMASSLTSHDLDAVRKETIQFLEKEMNLKPVNREEAAPAR
ncbi:alpha/beta hydrolase [Fulvivirga sedimenti]|uniref:Alpha/beta fold hydrolase n=1 Tax=Fulvivirga sedimenti TaxID=2879465 RepID=A0A9X1HVD0_9BACT|nr:alpha/beta fold hydrolase [Fulvivirga sedimenti]MCA6078591.1 alpha/beta fold hydrolase [Fulvivirga sedimenti]